MKRLALLCILFLPLATWAQRQYYLPAAGASGEEKDKPMIEVYLPKETNGSCVPSVASDQRLSGAVVLCPSGKFRVILHSCPKRMIDAIFFKQLFLQVRTHICRVDSYHTFNTTCNRVPCNSQSRADSLGRWPCESTSGPSSHRRVRLCRSSETSL